MARSTTALQATGVLKTQSWDHRPFAEVEGAPRLAHDEIVHVFEGDIEATGTGQMLNAYLDESSAIYWGVERVVGRIGERQGTFALQSSGLYKDGVADTTWSVVPGSGTGDLTGLVGEGSYVARSGEEAYSYRLEYRFE